MAARGDWAIARMLLPRTSRISSSLLERIVVLRQILAYYERSDFVYRVFQWYQSGRLHEFLPGYKMVSLETSAFDPPDSDMYESYIKLLAISALSWPYISTR